MSSHDGYAGGMCRMHELLDAEAFTTVRRSARRVPGPATKQHAV